MMTIACPITPIDPDPARTVTLAAQLASRQDATLSLVDVAPPAASFAAPSVPPAVPVMAAMDSDDDELHAVRRRRELERLGRMGGCDALTVETVQARPREVVCRLADRPDVELLVVRDTGGGALRSWVAGSVGRDVMREVRCPIVLVPPESGRPLGPEPVLVGAVADDDLAPSVAAFAAHLARALDAWLHIVHVDDGGTLAPLARERLIVRCQSAMPPGADVTFASLEGRAGPLLEDEVEALEADFVVTGSPRHGVLGSALTGSVVHRLLSHSTAPVVVVPDELQPPAG